MKNSTAPKQPFPHMAASLATTILLLGLSMASPSRAQIMQQYSAQYPGYPQGGYPGQQYSGQQPGYNPSFQNQNPQNNGGSYPEGVFRAYGLEADNSILLDATPDGYWRARELVKSLGGDLDIIRTEVALVNLTPNDLKQFGISVDAAATLSGDEAGQLVAAYNRGKIRPVDSVDIITRENTSVDASLQRNRVVAYRDRRSGMPLTIVPRVNKDGTLAVEVIVPVTATRAAKSGDTTVLSIPSQAGNGSVSLLFLTATLMPSDYRPGR